MIILNPLLSTNGASVSHLCGVIQVVVLASHGVQYTFYHNCEKCTEFHDITLENTRSIHYSTNVLLLQ